jgi:predicted DNA-binding ribbon-helix-helix protein
MKHRRIDIHGHQTSLALEPEYWGWLYEIAAKTGTTIKPIIEVISATKNPHRSLASEVRVAVTSPRSRVVRFSDVPWTWTYSPQTH